MTPVKGESCLLYKGVPFAMPLIIYTSFWTEYDYYWCRKTFFIQLRMRIHDFPLGNIWTELVQHSTYITASYELGEVRSWRRKGPCPH